MVATALKAEILKFQQIKFNKILNKTKPKKKKKVNCFSEDRSYTKFRMKNNNHIAVYID